MENPQRPSYDPLEDEFFNPEDSDILDSGLGNRPFQPLYAGFWLRFAASFIDGLLLSVAYYVLIQVFFEGGETVLARINEFYLLSIVVNWIYFAAFESSDKQATPGKQAVGIIVTDRRGRRISFGHATGRFFAKIVSAITLYIGFIMAGLTQKKQGLHDMMADTLVVKR